MLGQIIDPWDGHFNQIRGQKNNFLDFLKVALELEVFHVLFSAFNRPPLDVFSAEEVDTWP